MAAADQLGRECGDLNPRLHDFTSIMVHREKGILMRIVLIGTAAACLSLAGCAAHAYSNPEIPIAFAESRRLQFWGVHAHNSAGKVEVYGRVMRRSLMSGSVAGHLHIEAFGGGKVLALADTRWSQLGKRRLPGGTFSAKLRVSPAEVDEVRVSHVPGRHSAGQ